LFTTNGKRVCDWSRQESNLFFDQSQTSFQQNAENALV
jgi:hypothetical protein